MELLHFSKLFYGFVRLNFKKLFFDYTVRYAYKDILLIKYIFLIPTEKTII